MATTTEDSVWEATWEVEFPATKLEEVLLAMVVRDLLHGASFDVELDPPEAGDLALDYTTGDELDGDSYILLVTAEATGPQRNEVVQEITEQLIDQLVDEAEELVRRCKVLGSLPRGDVVFETVSEEEERWDLVTADWLAPDGALVPYGFRPYRSSDRLAWPNDRELDHHGRILVVPFDDQLHLFAIPAPSTENGLSADVLPVLP